MMWRVVLFTFNTAIAMLNFTETLRYSDDIFIDANLLVPDLIRKYHYPVEVHHVTTMDGYILELQRIPHGRNNGGRSTKSIVFLMHGLFGSSSEWVVMGPGHGLAYILADEGYDVWMGNARGNKYSRRHISLDPDRLINSNFWKFSWDEIGNIDLPTMIDFVLDNSGQKKLHFVGHSMGTTVFFVMASLRPAYNDKIISMHALAPVAFMTYSHSPLMSFIAPFSTQIATLSGFFGLGEVLDNSKILSWAGQRACLDEVIFQPICSSIVFLVGGWNEAELNRTMLPVIVGHMPAGASVRQVAHYGQGVANKGFRRYDHGLIFNKQTYGTFTPPDYDLSKVTAPVYLHYSDTDPLAHVKDVERLWRELRRPMDKIRVPMTTFSHLDFAWGIDVKELVYDKVLAIISSTS